MSERVTDARATPRSARSGSRGSWFVGSWPSVFAVGRLRLTTSTPGIRRELEWLLPQDDPDGEEGAATSDVSSHSAVSATGNRRTGDWAADVTEMDGLAALLTDPQAGYIAQHLTWILQIGGVDSYLLTPSLPGERTQLIQVLEQQTRNNYVTAVGLKGPSAPPELHSEPLPIMALDHVRSFDPWAGFAPHGFAFMETVNATARRLMQYTHNSGLTDFERGVNWCLTHERGLFTAILNAAQQGYGLPQMTTRGLPIRARRRLVDITIAHPETPWWGLVPSLAALSFNRVVDVTELFPFVVSLNDIDITAERRATHGSGGGDDG